MKKLDPEFEARAAEARKPILSSDVWSREAADLLRIAAFAGFDVQEVMVRAIKSSRAERINVRTIERILGEYSAELHAAEGSIEAPSF